MGMGCRVSVWVFGNKGPKRTLTIHTLRNRCRRSKAGGKHSPVAPAAAAVGDAVAVVRLAVTLPNGVRVRMLGGGGG